MSYSETFESFDTVYPKRDPSDPFNLPTLNFVAELDTASMADEASLVPLSPISHSQADESLNGNFPSLAANHSPCSLNDMETDTTGLVRSLSQTSLGAIARSTSGPALSFDMPMPNLSRGDSQLNDIPMPNLARGDSQPFRFPHEQSSAPILEHPPAAPWDSLSSLSSFHPPASSASTASSSTPSTVHPHNSFVMSDSTTYSGKGSSASSTVVVKQEPASYLDAGTPTAKPLANTSGAPLPYLSTPPLNSSLYSKPAATTSSAYSKPLTVFTVSSSVKPEPFSSAAATGGSALSASTPKKRQRRRGPLDKEALAIRRAKHNQVEIRRRQRIAKSFSELKDLTSCDDTNKGVILQAAIEKLKQLEAQLASVQSSNKATPAPIAQPPAPTPAPTPAPAVSAASAANAAAQEEFYTNMFLNSGVSLLLLSLSGLMIDCNNNFAALVGRSRESLKGQTVSTGARNAKSPGQMPTSSVGVQQLLRSEQDVRQFFQAVNQLLRKEVGSSDVIKTVIRQDGSNKDIAVKSMLWLVNEQRASPPYVKCVLTPTDSPVAPSAFSNGRESIKQRVDADSALMRPVTVGAY